MTPVYLLRLLAALAMASAMASACAGRGGARTSFTSMDERAIADLLDRQVAAWNAGDLDGFMTAYADTPDLVFTSGAEIRRGHATTLAKYRQRYGDDRASMGQLAFDILEVRPVGAAAAVVLGTWRLTGTPNAGDGVFSLVLERTRAGWRIIHDHTSATRR